MHLRHHWQLNPEIDFLNHGSFGATPTAVLRVQREWRDALERDPIRFLAPERELESKLDHVRAVLAELIGADATDVAMVRNATDGVNAVVRSFPFADGDEIVVTNHGYNACSNAARYAGERWGAVIRVAEIPFPLQSSDQVLKAIERTFTARTRLLLVDHVTSPTGLVFPVKQIVQMAHNHGVRVLIDGAHAPGMLPLDIRSLGADYYAANHHKWLCAPKVSGFLWVAAELQSEVRPTIISHAANRPRPGRSRFLAEFDWTGTYDPTPLLAVPAAIEFLSSLFPAGLEGLMEANRTLALQSRDVLLEALDIAAPAPVEMIGSLVAVPLPAGQTPAPGQPDPLQQRLYDHHRIELPIFYGVAGQRILRISLQAYNDLDQVRRLAQALSRELSSAG